MIDFDLFYNTMSDNFLVKTDRASMSQSIEYRSPFCDIKRIERWRRCPVKWKVSFWKTKILMRKIIKNDVPLTILTRSKQWFEPPIQDWIINDWNYVELISWYEFLLGEWIINWSLNAFYKNFVFWTNKKKNYNLYIIRLFLFIRWYNVWIKW